MLKSITILLLMNISHLKIKKLLKPRYYSAVLVLNLAMSKAEEMIWNH